MKKKFSFLLFIILLNNLFGQESNYAKITYKAVYNEPSEVSESLKKLRTENQQYVKDFLESFKKIEFKLLYTKNESLFEVVEDIESTDDMHRKIAIIQISENKIRYVNNLTKQKMVQLEFMGNKFNVPQKFENYNWEITKDTTTINGLMCYKATTTKQIAGIGEFTGKNLLVTAWFTPSIPVSFGPNGFDGLPGLILSVSYGSIQLNASDINLDYKTSKKIEKPKGGIDIKDDKEMTEIMFKKYKELNSEKN
ncbi:MAG: GLPGLI family protein [Flavobacterium sp.]